MTQTMTRPRGKTPETKPERGIAPTTAWNRFPWFAPRWSLGMIDDLWNAPLLEEADTLLTPLADVVEDENALTVLVELPGLKKEDVKIQVDDNVLSISGEKKWEMQREEGKCVRKERRYGAFHRSLGLPPSVNPEEVEARLTDGVLRVRIPKRESAKPKSITIR